MTGTTPITNLPIGGVPGRVLVVGDPARVTLVVARLDNAQLLASNREYVTWTGELRGTRVAVSSHGVGTAGAAIGFEELITAGASRIIRAGTAGGLQPDVKDGDLVIATGAVRDDGVTRGLVPPEFPAVADHRVVSALCTAANASSPRTGVVLTSDVFYPHTVLGSNLEFWKNSGAIAVEMECAALFVIAALRNVKAGAILAIDGNPLTADDESMAEYDPNRGVVTTAVDTMVDVALDALVSME